ncbi:MAG: flavoprotein, partial [Candidatus Latescibacterota bacterium]|nr:flavoprotein [Candidatus Latescibacterota bacterium]
MLSQRRILLVVSGGIAAYKAPFIVRELIKRGAEVRVVLTAKAERFVAPSSLEVLSRHHIYDDLFRLDSEFPVLHVGLAEWADLIIIAPATAHILGRAAQGLADDLATTLL